MSDESKKCSSCGSPMKDGEKFCPNCGKQAGMTCRHCGSEISSTEKFCHSCGKPTTTEEPKPVKKNKQINQKRRVQVLPVAIIVGVIFIVLILVGALDGLMEKQKIYQNMHLTPKKRDCKSKGI